MSLAELQEHTRCWQCGYSLCGLSGDEVCPECGLLVSNALRKAPLVIRSQAQKWFGIFSLVCVVPLILVGFGFYLAAAFSIVEHDLGMYGSVGAFTLSSVLGVAAGWFMKVPNREFSAPAHVSMLLCVFMFLWLWPIRILAPSSSMGGTWAYLNNVFFLTIVVCALGSLAFQAKSFAIKTGMAEPGKRHISFDQISYLAFVSVGLMALGGLLKVVSPLIHLSDRLAGVSIGFGMLLGILPFIIWPICLYPIIRRLARWPIGER